MSYTCTLFKKNFCGIVEQWIVERRYLNIFHSVHSFNGVKWDIFEAGCFFNGSTNDLTAAIILTENKFTTKVFCSLRNLLNDEEI